MSHLPHITTNPAVCHGKPVVRGIYYLIVMLLGFSIQLSYAQKPTHFYVFVGEKIDVHEINLPVKPGTIILNQAFDATYKVVQNVAGNYTRDTIRFRAFDHYGFPAFARHRYVLLYVSDYNGKLYHEKYQFSPVFKAANGRWAGPYERSTYEHPFLKKTPTQVKPELIPFGPDAYFDIGSYNPAYVQHWFPAPYFRIELKKAFLVQGNYVEDLLQLQKEGVLKARGIF